MDDEERKLIEAGFIKTTLWLRPKEAEMLRALLTAIRNPADGMPPPLSPSERKGYKFLKRATRLGPKKKPPEGGS